VRPHENDVPDHVVKKAAQHPVVAEVMNHPPRISSATIGSVPVGGMHETTLLPPTIFLHHQFPLPRDVSRNWRPR
jgi:hypothetical protein